MRFIVLLCAVLAPLLGLLIHQEVAIVCISVGVVAFEVSRVRQRRARARLIEYLGMEVAESRERSYLLLEELDRRFVRLYGQRVQPSSMAFPLSQDNPRQIRARLDAVWKPQFAKDDSDDHFVVMPGSVRRINLRSFYRAFYAWLRVYGPTDHQDPLQSHTEQ